MPRAALLPTPASSTDLPGQDGTKQLASTLQVSFELPPPAMASSEAPRPPSSDAKASPAAAEPPFHPSSKTPYPLQAAETVKSRRRSSAVAQAVAKDSFALPPPPTRSRKIIQMKPRAQDDAQAEPSAAASSNAKALLASAGAAAAPAAAAAAAPASAPASKKKQPSATSAAGRKIARKTAHSLIERRRRSKMNEEFSVLKDMIPACTGEMHKLAILQASIEYIRYLEDCVTKLKGQREGPASASSPMTEAGLPTPSGREAYNPEHVYHSYQDQQSPDVDMTGSELPSPTFTANAGRSSQPSISPALLAEDSRRRQNSYSSTSTDKRHYSYSASAGTSPAFGPQGYSGYARGSASASASGSTLTSPPLLPQRDLDQEATAALLMLNSDRRSTNASGRGMSVRDLLST